MDQTARTNLRFICDTLLGVGCDFVIVSYDGSGDSGQIENIAYYKSTKESPSDIIADAVEYIDDADYFTEGGSTLAFGDAEIFRGIDGVDASKPTSRIPCNWGSETEPEKVGTLEEAIEAFVYANIPTPGWENNAGGQGCCLISVHGMTAKFKHADRIEDVSTCETTISMADEGDGL